MSKNKFGPDFLPISAIHYKTEYLFISIALIYLLYQQYAIGKLDITLLILFGVLPDLVFLPMLPFLKNKNWPSWGSKLYNLFHSLATFFIIFTLSWITLGSIFWPLLGWALHITIDRTVGYTLRNNS